MIKTISPEGTGTGKISIQNCGKFPGWGRIITHTYRHRHGQTEHDHPHEHAKPHPAKGESSHAHKHQ